VFCQGDGRPWNPDHVSKRFRALAVRAGLPPIKLHEARHSAISLMRDAGMDREIRMREAGHADQAVADRYAHILDEAHRAAAGQTESYVLGDGGAASAGPRTGPRPPQRAPNVNYGTLPCATRGPPIWRQS